ncbi:hypothetical protein C806_00708 [Lachnospiraceae bacterium 3-1]|nr:hypothetical protein C806_00708 [Lachnospiraceae bacterium 3-1]
MKVTSYMASGVASSSIQGTISTRNMQKNTRASKKSSQNKGKKKNVNYNPREIRSALSRVKKAQSAGQVLAQAKGKLANLLKAKGTGQFNEAQLAAAIIHARRMVRCAQMKTQNLKQEEQLQKRHAKEVKAEEQQQKNEIKLRVKQKEQNLKQKARMDKSQRIQKQKRQQQELMQKRRIHRNMEHEKMEEADLEYKKNMGNASNYSENEAFAYAYVPTEGVELKLSEDGIELTEAQIEAQIEQQIEMMVAAEMTVSTGVPDISAGAATTVGGGADMSGGDVPSVDLVV